jgi:protein-tyrosine phosphatase
MTLGRIDIHSHLLPGIDDGCQTLDESIDCIRQLQAVGYTGSICTPHIWPDYYPNNTPENIATWTTQFAAAIQNSGIQYQVWPGGELRLFPDVIAWMQVHGVPTLADSRCVMFDYWDDKWPRWVPKVIEWFFAENYQPIMAHPERIAANAKQPKKLQELIGMGVWLQGNFRSMTGEEGYIADQLVRQLITEQRYQFMAMDMHDAASLPGRLDGMQLVAAEFGQPLVDHFTITAPWQAIFNRLEDQ